MSKWLHISEYIIDMDEIKYIELNENDKTVYVYFKAGYNDYLSITVDEQYFYDIAESLREII